MDMELRAAAAPSRRAPRFSAAAAGAQPGRWQGAPIDLSLKNADLRDVLRSFAKLGGFNLVIDPAVKGEVTVEFDNVPWDQALHVILKVNGLAAEIDGRIWAVEPVSIAIERARQ
jgi:type IV pilus assembly protein PilQ